MPRFDLLILSIAGVGGVLLVLADVYQRWIASERHPKLDIDGHENPEAWFHTMLLAGAAMCALGIACTFFGNRRRILWVVAGCGLAFFSLDKSMQLHEIAGTHAAHALGLSDASISIVWEVLWAPIILATAVALVLCVWEAPGRTKLWIGVAILGALGKVGLEGLTYPLKHFDYMHEGGSLYGLEVNIEESSQLLAFAAVFAGFAQLLVDRLVAFAPGETRAAAPEAHASAGESDAARARVAPGRQRQPGQAVVATRGRHPSGPL